MTQSHFYTFPCGCINLYLNFSSQPCSYWAISGFFLNLTLKRSRQMLQTFENVLKMLCQTHPTQIQILTYKTLWVLPKHGMHSARNEPWWIKYFVPVCSSCLKFLNTIMMKVFFLSCNSQISSFPDKQGKQNISVVSGERSKLWFLCPVQHQGDIGPDIK